MSQQIHELIDTESCLSNDGSERTSVQFFMIRHGDLGERLIPAEDHMAAFLTPEDESGFR